MASPRRLSDRPLTELRGHSLCHRLCAAAALTLLVATPPLFADTRGDAKAQVTFGLKVAQQGLWREAKYRFERAVAIDPMYAAARNNLAIACEQLGHIDKAKQAYEKAVALAPKDDVIRQNYELYLEIHARAERGGHRLT